MIMVAAEAPPDTECSEAQHTDATPQEAAPSTSQAAPDSTETLHAGIAASKRSRETHSRYQSSVSRAVIT